LTLKRVKRITDEQLGTKGYGVTPGRPDFLIAITGKKDTKADHWKDGDTFTYEEGTLVLEFLDGKTKEPIWRGKAVGVLDPSPTPEQREKNTNKAVARMLKNFPPPR
jgi:hypothetical protein